MPRATPRIRDIVFDLGGVLVDWDPRHLFVRHRGEDTAAVERFLCEVCSPSWHATLDRGNRFAPAIAALAQRHPGHAEWIAAYESQWEHMFAGAVAETVELLGRCRERGFAVHALTNYPPQKIAFLYRRFPFMREFDTVVVSGLLGRIKPDPVLFEYLRDRIGGRAFLFIDDRLENVHAARRSGVPAMHFEGPDTVNRLAERIEAASDA